jgi:hypothetical protein
VSFQVFWNLTSSACLSQREANYHLWLYTENVDGLAVTDEKPWKLDQTFPHNFGNFQLFQSLISPACSSQQEANYHIWFYTKRGWQPSRNEQTWPNVSSLLCL